MVMKATIHWVLLMYQIPCTIPDTDVASFILSSQVLKLLTLEMCKPRLQEIQRLACGCGELMVEMGLRPHLAEARVHPMTPADPAPGMSPFQVSLLGPSVSASHFPLWLHFCENQEELNVLMSFLQHRSERGGCENVLSRVWPLMLRRDSRTLHRKGSSGWAKFMSMRTSGFASCQGEMKNIPQRTPPKLPSHSNFPSRTDPHPGL